MSALHFVSEIISGSTTVLVTRSQLPLAQEIIRQLKSYSHITVLETTDPSVENLPEKTQVIIHFAGFEKPSLAESLFHTSTLHRLMDWAIRSNSKLVLVLPDMDGPEQQTAVSLLTQFGKNFSLKYHIARVDRHDALVDSAEQILGGFIKGHKHQTEKPMQLAVSRPVVVSHPEPLLRKQTNEWGIGKWILAVVIGLLVVPWTLYLIQLGAIVAMWKCQSCLPTVKTIAHLTEVQTNWVLGASWVIQKTGLSDAEFFSVLTRAAEVQASMANIMTSTKQLWHDPTQAHTQNLSGLLADTSEQLAYLQTDVQKVAGTLPQFTKKLSPLITDIQAMRTVLGKYNIVSADLAKIAQSSHQEWLVLLQDSNEIRPSGGFLTSFALVSIEKGQIADIQFHTTYSTDGMLRGQVKPPADLKTATGETSWYMRDSNWAVDFPTVAEKTAWFVNKELGRKVDGVIAVNLSAYPELLKAIGPVESDDFSGEVSEANVLAKSIELAKSDSTETPFIESITKSMVEKASTATESQKENLLQALVRLLETRQILVTPLNVSHRFGLVGWSGDMPGTTCATTLPCVNDFVYIIDSNVGVNKANVGVTSEYHAEVSMDDTSMTNSYTISYTNTNAQSSWPLGNYKNYLRIVLPIDTHIKSLTMAGKVVADRDYSVANQNNRQVVGMLVEVPVGTTRVVKIVVDRSIVTSDKFSYQFQWLNQPGSKASSVQWSLRYPTSLTASAIGATLVASTGQLRYNTLLAEPSRLYLTFSRATNGN